MFVIVFKLFFVAAALVLIAFAAANAFRKARRLDRRIKDFKAEQEELKQQGVVLNPYAAMAELYAEDAQRAAEAEARRAAKAQQRTGTRR